MQHAEGDSSRQSRSALSSSSAAAAAATVAEEETAAAAQAMSCVAILMQHPTNAQAMKRGDGLRQLAELVLDSEDSEVGGWGRRAGLVWWEGLEDPRRAWIFSISFCLFESSELSFFVVLAATTLYTT